MLMWQVILFPASFIVLRLSLHDISMVLNVFITDVQGNYYEGMSIFYKL